MAESSQNQAAGGKPPAAAVSGPLWRERRDTPIYQVELWPNQSLTGRGLKFVLWVTGCFLAFPLLYVFGTPVFWGLLPFMGLAFWALWFAIKRNGQNLRLNEVLSVWSDEIRVERREADGRVLRWQADPVRARVKIHNDARIEDYLTMTGGGREIEVGAFLAPEERVALADEIEKALTAAIRGGGFQR